VFQWLKKEGGLVRPLAHEHPVHPRGFELDGEFLKGADARGMMQLKGHRAVGGMRASIRLQGVKRLVEYMRELEAKRG
jgi:phosphoserine aminotransferase